MITTIIKIWGDLCIIAIVLLLLRKDRKDLLDIVFFKNGDVIAYIILWVVLIIGLPITIPYSIKHIKK